MKIMRLTCLTVRSGSCFPFFGQLAAQSKTNHAERLIVWFVIRAQCSQCLRLYSNTLSILTEKTSQCGPKSSRKMKQGSSKIESSTKSKCKQLIQFATDTLSKHCLKTLKLRCFSSETLESERHHLLKVSSVQWLKLHFCPSLWTSQPAQHPTVFKRSLKAISKRVQRTSSNPRTQSRKLYASSMT